MKCPICGGNNLSIKREEGVDPYNFSNEKNKSIARKGASSEIEARYFDERKMLEKGKDRYCHLCGYSLRSEWKFCPECGA